MHMDCLHWVNRDSYLPQGSRGLKVGGWVGQQAGRQAGSACAGNGQPTCSCCFCAFHARIKDAPRSLRHMYGMYCLTVPHVLPASQMVTKYKLGYDPVEVDPEDMVRRYCWLYCRAEMLDCTAGLCCLQSCCWLGGCHHTPALGRATLYCLYCSAT